jgi:hypothetical protein
MGQAVRFTFVASPSLDRVEFALVEYAHLLDDWRPSFKIIEKMFYAHERGLFATSGKGKATKKWPQWKKLSTREPPKGGYRAYKAKVRPGRPILVFDGALRDAASGGPGSIRGQIKKKSMVIGIDPGGSVGVIARAHALGDPARGLPSRPPVRFDGDVRARGITFGYAVSQVLQSHIVLKRKQAMKRDPAVNRIFENDRAAQQHRSRLRLLQRKQWK